MGFSNLLYNFAPSFNKKWRTADKMDINKKTKYEDRIRELARDEFLYHINNIDIRSIIEDTVLGMVKDGKIRIEPICDTPMRINVAVSSKYGNTIERTFSN